MLLNAIQFHKPKTLKELLQIIPKCEHFKIQAGGTFLINSLKLMKRKGSRTPDHIISLSHIDELKGININKNELMIKSMTTIADIFNSPIIEEHIPVLKKVCRNISTQPIRNMASIGGNLTCRYTWTEMPAAIIGLNATLHFINEDGKSVVVDPEQFYQAQAKTNHILTRISIPLETNRIFAYQRHAKSQEVDIPLLSLMISAKRNTDQLSDVCVAVNNCVNFAQRDRILETFLNKTKISDKLPELALNNLTNDIYDTRSSDYKKTIFRVCLKRAINEMIKT